jgi:hypothetical protein
MYQNTKYSHIIHHIIDLDIPFDLNWNSIGVAVSGGADSALLAFLLCKIIQENNLAVNVHIISNIRGWKTKPWQQYDSLNVFQWLVNRFPNINFSRHINFVPPEFEWADKGPTIIDEYGKLVSGDNIELRAFAEYISHYQNLQAYFNAVTRNPDCVDGGMPTRDIISTAENSHLLIMEHMGKIASHPFRFTTKDKIIRAYHLLGITDLLNITRSCEGEIEGINYLTYTPNQFVPTCGKCFWCKEREWANEKV